MDYRWTSRWRAGAQRVNELLLGVPVFVKIMGIALGLALVLGGGMLWQIHRAWHAHLIRGLEERGQKIASEAASHCAELSRAGLAADIPAELHRWLTETPDVAYLVLQASNGLVLAEARPAGAPPAPARVREVRAPLGQGSHHLRVGLSLARLEEEVGWLTRRLARTTALIALLGMLAAWWLTHLFAHPLRELVLLSRAVKRGDYRAHALIRARDEVGELAAAFNEMTEAIAQKEAARQRLLHRVIIAAEEERKRAARELHDETGQALTSLIAGLGALESGEARAAQAGRIAELRRQAEQTLAGVHDLSVALRPSVLDDLGLMPALERHGRVFGQRFGVEITCAGEGVEHRRLPAEVELTIYRLTQESLANAVRHGQASRIRVFVQRTAQGVLTTVRDNGRGFDARHWQQRAAQGDRLGLLGLKERISLLGGSFCVESEPGRGVQVYAQIPLPAETEGPCES